MTENISAIISEALSTKYDISGVSISWEVPQDATHGDRASPLSLQIAKKVGAPPRDIAEYIVSTVKNHEDIANVEIAGPGYINIWFTSTVLLSGLKGTLHACKPQGIRTTENPVLIEYSSPNIAKPFGIHHILTTVIGQVLYNMYKHRGCNAIAINHLGDWGTQFGKVAVAYKKWGTKPLAECTVDDLLSLYVQFHAEVEKDESLEQEGRDAFKKLEQGDSDVRAFWEAAVAITMKEMNETYSQLHVQFDFTHGESFYEDKMAPVLQEGKEKGVFTQGEKGALIAQFPEETHMPPAIVLKSDGSTIYHTRDLATIAYRIEHFHPQSIVYVVGNEQKLYFQQLFAIVHQLQWNLPSLEHVSFGRMRFTDGAMSTRKGIVLKLQDVLDEAVERARGVIKDHGDSIQTDDPEELAVMMGRGAVVYGILSQNRKMDITFDWDTILSFDGNSAPYIQYTYARANSILQKAEYTHSTESLSSEYDLTGAERALLNILLRYEDVLEEARAAHMPHTLCNYIYVLCQQFNTFYSAEPILKAEGDTRDVRLLLTYATANVLKSGAHLLTMRVPERM